MSRTPCASHIATGIARFRSGRAAVLCDELVPDDVEKCPACGCESPATRARLAIPRMVDYFDSAHDPAGLALVPPDSPFAEGADDDPDAPGYWHGELGFPWDEYDLRPVHDGPDWSDES